MKASTQSFFATSTTKNYTKSITINQTTQIDLIVKILYAHCDSFCK